MKEGVFEQIGTTLKIESLIRRLFAAHDLEPICLTNSGTILKPTRKTILLLVRHLEASFSHRVCAKKKKPQLIYPSLADLSEANYSHQR